MTLEFSCHTVSQGYAEGEALISADPILFYHTDFTTGVFKEPGHSLEGKNIAQKILIFPGGKGSSVVQADGMYKLDMAHLAPNGLIVSELDTVLVASAIIMEVPMVNEVEPGFYREVRDGDRICLNATDGIITICH